MQEVVKVDLPIPLRIGGKRKIDAGELPSDLLLQHPSVPLGGLGTDPLPARHRLLVELRRSVLGPPALTVVRTLEREVVQVRLVEEEGHQRITAAVLVYRDRAMSDPLARHEHGHGTVELDLHHLAGRRVVVPAQIPDQTPSLAYLPGAVAIADAGGPFHVVVRAHVVDQGHETVVENGKIPPENLLRGGGRRSLGFHTMGFAAAAGETTRVPAE